MDRKIYKLVSGAKEGLFALALTLFLGTAYSQTPYPFNYTGSIQTLNVQPGDYKIECWGADGGDGSYYSGPSTNLINGGKGGYSTGTLTVAGPTTWYIVVGGKGSNLLTGNNPGGYNGGGNSSSPAFVAGSGGGASHVASATGLLNTLSGNQAAVIAVAGGGGGGGNQSLGGDGGGLIGVQPLPITQFSGRTAGGGGTQSGAGVCFSGGTGAGFGQGGTTSQNLAGGGGGGWYGGCTGDNSTAGGGGSGYIGGVNSGTTVSVGQPGFVPNPDVTGNGYVIITRLCAVNLTSAKNPICNGESVTLSTNAVSGISWTHNGSTSSSVNVSPTSNTTYTVIGQAATGCTTSVVLTVTVNPLPNLSAAVVPSVLCVGKTATISASGASSYTWTSLSISAPSATANPAVTTSYNYSGTNQYGCVNSSVVAVNVNTNTVSLTPNTTICEGQSITLTAGNAVTYTWSTGNNFPSTPVAPITNTTYMVSGTDIHNCITSNVVNITVDSKPNVSASASKNTICKGEAANLMASGASTYTWSGTAGTGAQVTINPPVDVVYSYTVTGTASNGCTNTAVVAVTVSRCSGLSKLNGDAIASRVYPNPAGSEVTVELNNGLVNTIEVMDLTGRIVLTTVTGEEKIKLNLNTLSNGVYYFKVRSADQVEVIKVVKNN